MDSTIIIAMSVAVCVASLGPSLTIFVLHRYGLVGGTPRELLKIQLELETARVATEREKLEIEKRRAEVQSELRKTALGLRQQQEAAPKPEFNPAMGMRGAPIMRSGSARVPRVPMGQNGLSPNYPPGYNGTFKG